MLPRSLRSGPAARSGPLRPSSSRSGPRRPPVASPNHPLPTAPLTLSRAAPNESPSTSTPAEPSVTPSASLPVPPAAPLNGNGASGSDSDASSISSLSEYFDGRKNVRPASDKDSLEIEDITTSLTAQKLAQEVESLRGQVSELVQLVKLQQDKMIRLESRLQDSSSPSTSQISPENSPLPELSPLASQVAPPGPIRSSSSPSALNNGGTTEEKPLGSALLRAGAESTFSNPFPMWRPVEPGGPLADPWPRKNFMRPLDLQAKLAYNDRRTSGQYDARFHSTSPQATPKDYRILPARIILVRHGESEGNVDNITYAQTPDNRVPLTERGFQQAVDAGRDIRRVLDAYHTGEPYNLFFYISPYTRSLQTYLGIRSAFPDERIIGVQEEVQLREQDPEGKKREKTERLRFGRFFYRFPNGESGADCYDRITGFQDHLIRDINAGRFANNTSLVLVTHGLALRIFLMRWFHWTIDQFLTVYNPPNAEPLILERNMVDGEHSVGISTAWLHTKALYTLSEDSKKLLKGVSDDMCRNSLLPKGVVLKKADI